MSALRARPRVVEVETTTTHDGADRRPLPGPEGAPGEHLLQFDFRASAATGPRARVRPSGRGERDTSIKDAIIKFLEQKL